MSITDECHVLISHICYKYQCHISLPSHVCLLCASHRYYSCQCQMSLPKYASKKVTLQQIILQTSEFKTSSTTIIPITTNLPASVSVPTSKARLPCISTFCGPNVYVPSGKPMALMASVTNTRPAQN